MMDRNHGWNITYIPVLIGFLLSLILAFAMYRVDAGQHLSGKIFTFSVFALAILQSLVQLVMFMGVGLENRPHWYSWSLVFTAVVILIIVGGSCWIMNNLNYNLMPMPMPTHGSF